MVSIVSDAEPLIGKRGSINLLNHAVVRDDDKADIVVVFPLKMSEEHCKLHQVKAEDQSIPAMYGNSCGWNDTVVKSDALMWAQKIFNNYQREEKESEADLATSKKNLEKDFNKDMPRVEFHSKIVQRMVDLLAGHKIALEVSTMLSADHDEMFLCLKVPENNERFDPMCANSEGYRAQINPECYKNLVPKYTCPRVLEKECPAWQTYQDEEAQAFMPFRPIDRLRLMSRRIGHFISWTEAERAGIINSTFVVHKWDQLEELKKSEMRFSEIRNFYLPPKPEDTTAVKEYFGEETAFFFHWFAFYIRKLAIPAVIGTVLFFRRYVGLTVVEQRLVQDGYAVFMAIWAAYFCETYSRLSLRQSTLWGTRNYDSVASVRPDYKEEHISKTTRWQRIGASVMAIFIMLIVSGIVIIQTFRATMIHHPSDVVLTSAIEASFGRHAAVKMGSKIGAILITMQIKIFDFVWGKMAVWITNKENHKTNVRWQKSLVFKTVLVKFFNAMYPFLYYAFAKEYVEGCRIPKMPNATKEEKIEAQMCACIAGLQLYIITFFVVHLSIVCAMLCKRMFFAKWKIDAERRKPGVERNAYSYLHVQAKTDAFLGVDMISDYMDATVQFGLVVCFSVVLPVLTLFSIFSNMLEYRLLAYRQCYIVQRAHPTGCEGIGAWLDIFRMISCIAIVANAGLAVFAMLPFKAYSVETKLLLFLCIEHSLLFLKLVVEVAIPDVPKDVDLADDKNEEAVARIFGGTFKRMHFEHSEFGTRGAIQCNIDCERWNERYEHCDLNAHNEQVKRRSQLEAEERDKNEKADVVKKEKTDPAKEADA
eukprot:GEMP01018977.1.p1 GENE.GEMP01018977.1~~GEMP01018977.1.p1  ORF type:complete len:820 (+),score=171.04 GEMP01018977.1:146-2605(+)